MKFPLAAKETHKALLRYSKAGLIGIVACSLIGYLGTFHRYCEQACHFRIQYCWCALLLLVVFACMRSWRWAAASAVILVLSALPVVPWYFGTATKGKCDLRMLLSNVCTSNRRYQDVVALIRKTSPDVVILEEMNEEWLKNVSSLNEIYPYRKVSIRSDNFGIALYSKYPLESEKVLYLGGSPVPSIFACVSIDGSEVSLLATHPLPPVRPENFFVRNRQLESIGRLASRQKRPFVLIGDLNTTMWSPYYQKMEKESGLKNARRGFGPLPTWPVGSPLQIPLDHCLYSHECSVVDFFLGNDIGSDHYPVLVDLAIER